MNLRRLYLLVRAWFAAELRYKPDCRAFIWARNGSYALSGRWADILHILLQPTRLHIRFLMRYFLRKGGWAVMPRGFLKRTVRDGMSSNRINIGEVVSIDPNHVSGEVHDFFYAVGKFMCIKGIDAERSRYVYVAFDRYEFYPWCGVSDHYRYNCDCDNRTRHWADIDLTLIAHAGWKFVHGINWMLEKLHRPALNVYEEADRLHWWNRWLVEMLYKWCTAHVSDQFFVGKGKPFMSTGTLDAGSWKLEAIRRSEYHERFIMRYGFCADEAPIIF